MKHPVDVHVGKRVRHRRWMLGVTQQQLGEQVGIYRWSAVVVGFCGALIIIRPGSDVFEWTMLFFICSMTCYSFYQIVTRMSVAADSAATTITYTALVGAIVSSIAIPFFWETPHDLIGVLLFLAIGAIGGFGHYLVVKSLQYAEASLVAPIGYGQLIGAVILGYFVFGDFPDLYTWVGAAIVIASGLFITYREQVRAKASRGAA